MPDALWGERTAERYEKWFATRAGAFALACEKRLLNRLMSGWPRRGQTLLEVGCGTGVFLDSFWEAGFDITGLDSSQPMLQAACKRLGNKAELRLGNACALPFDDREFDFVAVLTVLEFLDDPMEALKEARRVARKGLLVAFLNKYSLYYLQTGMNYPRPFKSKNNTMRSAHWFSPLEMRKMLSQAAPGKRLSMYSVLPGPVLSWRAQPPFSWVNRVVTPFWFGGYCGAKVNLLEDKPMTSIPLFSKSSVSTGGPAGAAF